VAVKDVDGDEPRSSNGEQSPPNEPAISWEDLVAQLVQLQRELLHTITSQQNMLIEQQRELIQMVKEGPSVDLHEVTEDEAQPSAPMGSAVGRVGRARA
jgi:hypothetical protein